MRDFKPNKKKALLTATSTTLLQKAEKVVEVVTIKYPAASGLMDVVLASLNIGLAYKQEKLNQFVEHLMDHPEIYSPAAFTTREFQDGVTAHLQTYLNLRGEEKLKLAHNIFYDFGKSREKPEYPLERYDDTLAKISQQGIRFLGFIHTEVPQLRVEYTKKKIKENKNDISKGGFKNWHKIYGESASLDKLIALYVPKKARVDRKLISEDSGSKGNPKRQDKIRYEFSLLQDELVQLGMAAYYESPGGWDVPKRHWNLNVYGRNFLSIIMPDER